MHWKISDFSKKNITIVLFLCIFSHICSSDWKDKVKENFPSFELDTSPIVLTYEDLAGTYWIPMSLTEWDDSDSIIVNSNEGFMFLPNNQVIRMSIQFSAEKIDVLNEVLLNLSIYHIYGIYNYIVEDNKIIFDSYEIELVNNRLEIKGEYAVDSAVNTYFLYETFPVESIQESLWSRYIRRVAPLNFISLD